MPKDDIVAWLNTLPEGAMVGVDDGGLALRSFGDYRGPTFYLEIGGVPEDD